MFVPTGSAGHLTEEIARLGPWFHNMAVGGCMTAPDHALGDFPSVKWHHLQQVVPADLQGKSVLDIGCNAGFYSQRFAERGASRVLGIDANSRYLEQAQFAANVNGCDIEFRKLSVYELDQVEEQFDYVLFLGVFYHLRYPLFALDKVVEKLRGRLLFQSLIRPKHLAPRPFLPPQSVPFEDQAIFQQPEFPRMHFIEHQLAGDPTNWWIPNESCIEAILRTAGLRITGRPEDETWLCERDEHRTSGLLLQQSELNGSRS